MTTEFDDPDRARRIDGPATGVLALVLLAGCRPIALDQPEWTERQLLVREQGEQARLALLRVGDDPQSIPQIPRPPLDSVFWASEGDVLLGGSEHRLIYRWSEADDEPSLFHIPRLDNGYLPLSLSPDSRYVRITEEGELDIYHYDHRIFDVISGAELLGVFGCGDQGPFAWRGDGPDALQVSVACDGPGFGDPSEYVLYRTTADARSELYRSPDPLSTLSVAPGGARALAVRAEGWSLHDLETDALLLDEPLEPQSQVQRGFGWSHDGQLLVRTAGGMLFGYAADGTLRWQHDIGNDFPAKIQPSPVDERMLAVAGHHSSSIHIVDMRNGDTRDLDECLTCSAATWTPRGDAVIFDSPQDSLTPGKIWLDLETGERRAIATAEGSIPQWSPDGEAFLITIPCNDEDEPPVERAIVFDATGHERAEIPCGAYTSLRWSPDSDAIATTRRIIEGEQSVQASIVVFDLDGRELDLGPGSAPKWRPGPIR